MYRWVALALSALLTSCGGTPPQPASLDHNSIAFGAGLHQWQSQPVWNAVLEMSPRAFVFLGDTVYTDTGPYSALPEPQRISDAYKALAEQPDFRYFRAMAEQQQIALFATWDDHDYGRDEGGGDYPHKLASKQFFTEFFQPTKLVTPADSPGVYQSYRLSLAELDVQLILLDTRSFRSPLEISPPDEKCDRHYPVENTNDGATILGEAQWQWLEETLSEPADLRIIASSIQVLPTEHCFEKWQSFPFERDRLFSLIANSDASGVVLISGDRHLGEISVYQNPDLDYPLYEVTASGLNSAMGFRLDFRESNRRRTHKSSVVDDHFGSIRLGGSAGDREIQLQLRNTQGIILQQIAVPLENLQANSKKQAAES